MRNPLLKFGAFIFISYLCLIISNTLLMKYILFILSIILAVAMNAVAQTETATVKVKMTYVDYNNYVAVGERDTIQVGCNKVPSVGGTTTWGIALTDNEWSADLTYEDMKDWTVSAMLGGGDLVSGTQKYYNTKDGRAIMTIGDALVRGTDGTCSKNTYSDKGAISRIGSDKNKAIANNINLPLEDATEGRDILDEQGQPTGETETVVTALGSPSCRDTAAKSRRG